MQTKTDLLQVWITALYLCGSSDSCYLIVLSSIITVIVLLSTSVHVSAHTFSTWEGSYRSGVALGTCLRLSAMCTRSQPQ